MRIKHLMLPLLFVCVTMLTGCEVLQIVDLAFKLGELTGVNEAASKGVRIIEKNAYLKSAGLINSKYFPFMHSYQDYEDYLKLLQQDQNKIVHDENGSHYFSFSKDNTTRQAFSLSRQYDQATRKLLSKGRGLIEPIYELNNELELRPNWELTELKYNYLVGVAKLNLLPLEYSKKYNKLLLNRINAVFSKETLDYSKAPSNFIYDKDLYIEVLSHIPEAEYLVLSDTSRSDMALNIKLIVQKVNNASDKKNQLNLIQDQLVFLNHSSSMYIVPVIAYKEMQMVGSLRLNLGVYCTTTDIKKEGEAKKLEFNYMEVWKTRHAEDGYFSIFFGKNDGDAIKLLKESISKKVAEMNKENALRTQQNMEFFTKMENTFEISGSQKTDRLD